MDKTEARKAIKALIGARYAFTLSTATEAGAAVALVHILAAPGSEAAKARGTSCLIARAPLPRIGDRRAFEWGAIVAAVRTWTELPPVAGAVGMIDLVRP